MSGLDLDMKKHQPLDILDLPKPKSKIESIEIGQKTAKKKSYFVNYTNEHEHNEVSVLEQFNREECNKDFRKGFKKVFLFKVLKSACMGDL